MTKEQQKELAQKVKDGELGELEASKLMCEDLAGRISDAVMPFSDFETPFLITALRLVANAIEADANDKQKGISTALLKVLGTIACRVPVKEEE